MAISEYLTEGEELVNENLMKILDAMIVDGFNAPDLPKRSYLSELLLLAVQKAKLQQLAENLMKTLLEISDDLVALQQTLESLEDASEEQAAEVAAWFAGLEKETHEERDRKLDNYCALIDELEARAAARKAEAKRLNDRAKVDENKAKSLKSRLHEFFECHQIKTVETLRYRLSLVSNGGQLPIVLDENYTVTQMPKAYVQTSQSPNLDAIRQALQAGEVLEFARLGERGKSIRIK